MWLYYALGASILWGLCYTINGYLLHHIQTHTLLFIQYGAGLIFFLFLKIFFPHELPIGEDFKWLFQNKVFFSIILLSVLITLTASFWIYQSIQFKNPVMAALIEVSYPIFTLFFCYVLFNQNFMSLKSCLGGFFIIIGVIILGLS